MPAMTARLRGTWFWMLLLRRKSWASLKAKSWTSSTRMTKVGRVLFLIEVLIMAIGIMLRKISRTTMKLFLCPSERMIENWVLGWSA